MDSPKPGRDWQHALHAIARNIGLAPQVESFWFLRHGESIRNAAHIILEDLGHDPSTFVPLG